MQTALKNKLKQYPLIARLWNFSKTFFAVCSPKNNAYRIKNRLDGGLPLPPPALMSLVAGTSDVEWFLSSGKMGATSLQAILQKNHLNMEGFTHVLDFGCGVGRVIRYWAKVDGPEFYGTDYNPVLVEWSRDHLKFATFQVNSLAGHLDYADETFDFVYALSVFTHLREPEQVFWIGELTRVLKPGGYLFFTVQGQKFYLPSLTPEDKARFLRGELIVHRGEYEGQNLCTAYHPEHYVRTRLVNDLVVLDYIPEGALGNPKQDAILVRKPIEHRPGFLADRQ